MSELNINIDLNDLVRDYSFRGSPSDLGKQLGKLLEEESSFRAIIAIAIIKYHHLEGNYTSEEAKIRMSLAMEDPEEVLGEIL